MAKSVVVSHLDNPASSSIGHSSSVQEPCKSSRIPGDQPPSAQENEPSYLSSVRQQLQGLGFTTISIEVITSSWREGTASQYQTYLQKWLAFCRQQCCDILSRPIPMAVDFLSMLYERGSSYSTINTALSILSFILQFNSNLSIPFGQLPVVRRFIKGIFEPRPALPRYKSIWDISLAWFFYSFSWTTPGLKDFTVKLTFFLSLLNGQRSQTINSLTTVNMELSTDKCVFNVTDKMKQTRVGTHVAHLVFLPYSADEKLCILTHLKKYIKRTSHLRNGTKQLLLSHSKPHGPVSTDTISRWGKAVLSTAGVDVSKFKGHCTRAASTSFLASHNISIEEMGFGPNFLQLIRTFYRNLTSCVLNNGFTTDIFFVKRGVRQGDPLSPLLFTLALETLVCRTVT